VTPHKIENCGDADCRNGAYIAAMKLLIDVMVADKLVFCKIIPPPSTVPGADLKDATKVRLFDEARKVLYADITR
jgi:hypothetical protein